MPRRSAIADVVADLIGPGETLILDSEAPPSPWPGR
jgi:hypothetical protein